MLQLENKYWRLTGSAAEAMAGNPPDSCSLDSKPAKQDPCWWWSGRPSCRMTKDLERMTNTRTHTQFGFGPTSQGIDHGNFKRGVRRTFPLLSFLLAFPLVAP